MRMNARVSPPLTWHICCIIVNFLSLVVSTYILNQSKGHALNSTISMSLKFRDGNVVYELSCLASNIKKEVIKVLDSFLSFLKKYEEKKAHDMLPLMLDPRFKTFRLVSSLIGHEPLLKNMTKNLYFLCL
jgi:hypothetical protein